MKSKYILLVIGILSIAASIYMIIEGEELTNKIMGLVCGASLIYGYYELGQQEKKSKHY